ncbi:unnamed protein product [Brassica napus]|uniref:U6 snRNA-associated Sm-like protein LSm1 n=1 Tax=Brassica napus TaxID=3708 RepID=A0A816UJW3_BRANA|nr:unnamed protein product [Brassica napus]
MSWAAPDDIFFSTSLAAYLDKKLLVLLRDGRKLMGLLRSFDQFANAVIEEAYERVIVGDLYCDIPLGLYIIRGENVVLIGELDIEKEELPAQMVQVSEAEIKRVSEISLASMFVWWFLDSTDSSNYILLCKLGSESRERRNAIEGFDAEKNGVP